MRGQFNREEVNHDNQHDIPITAPESYPAKVNGRISSAALPPVREKIGKTSGPIALFPGSPHPIHALRAARGTAGESVSQLHRGFSRTAIR